MNTLLRRLKKLEATTTRVLDGPWLWPARAEAVRRRTMEAMSPQEQTLLTESLGRPGFTLYQEFAAAHPDLWTRYQAAFDQAARGVPAPYVMCIADLWGCW
jgi:hypothetical protein